MRVHGRQMRSPFLEGKEAAKPPSFSLSLWERAGVRGLAFATTLALTACGTPNACLANRYDGYAPRAQCISGLQLPHDVLKDTDPMSGSAAPVSVAQ